jgi:hypothetical protein
VAGVADVVWLEADGADEATLVVELEEWAGGPEGAV